MEIYSWNKTYLTTSLTLNLLTLLFAEGRSDYWILYDYMLYNKNTYLHTSPAAGGYTLDIEQMGEYQFTSHAIEFFAFKTKLPDVAMLASKDFTASKKVTSE